MGHHYTDQAMPINPTSDDPATVEAITRYLHERRVFDQLGEHRLYDTCRALNSLQRSMGDVPLLSATDRDVTTWMLAMSEGGFKETTIGKYLKAVKPFFGWAWHQELITSDQLLRIKSARAPRGAYYFPPRPYSRDELAILWANLDSRFPYVAPRIIEGWLSGKSTVSYSYVYRHVTRLQLDVLIDLALVCGLRRSEIYKLTLKDCHWDNFYITVHGKRLDHNPKIREVPYPDSTRIAMQQWIRARNVILADANKPLWVYTRTRNKYMPEPLGRGLHFDDFRTQILMVGEFEWHRLRHTCATERLRAGMPIEKLSRFLGHSNIQQTLGYAQLVRSDIHAAAELIDPAFQKAIKPHVTAPPVVRLEGVEHVRRAS